MRWMNVRSPQENPCGHCAERQVGQSEGVRMSGKQLAAPSQDNDASGGAAQSASRGREPGPYLEERHRSLLAQLFRMIEEQVHEVRADDSAHHGPGRGVLQR